MADNSQTSTKVHYTRGTHPTSLANLTPITAENRANGRNAGASTIEWFNRLDDPKYTDAELVRIRDDEKECRAKRRAAAAHVRMIEHAQDFAKNGAPLVANDLDRLLDRTHGRAVQRVEVQQQQIADPAALKLELARLIAEHPEALASMGLVPALALPEADETAADNAADNVGVSGACDPPGAPNPGSDAVE